SPTAAIALTAVLALIVFLVGIVLGIKKFGVMGYLKSLCPKLGLPMYLAVVIVPLVWLIEFASLFIKHGILAIRLLANMVAGHLVILGIMALAFGVHAADMHVGSWTALSLIAVLGTVIISLMELFVAFLQAYVFTLLAALFIGSATHGH
ncbi:MAG: F0F1 ATP synthase subunit A, partial [Planctomycetales bacterium]|nr:F0F1 ATP synthase subunit A [Planctomycetales bacterium]